MALTLLLIGLFVFMGHLLVAIFQRTRVPDVLLLILVGVLIGPYGLKLIAPGDLGKIGPVFSTIALLVLLFEGGMGLNIRAIFSTLWPCTKIAFTTALVTLAIAAGVAYVFTQNVTDSIALGVMLSCVSAAVVIPLSQQLPIHPNTRTLIVLESAVTDVVAILGIFFVERLATEGSLSLASVAVAIPMAVITPLVLGFVGAAIWLLVVERVRKFPNTAFTEFALVCVLYGVTESLHGNGAIAALAFGVCVTNLPREVVTRFKRFPLLKFDRITHAQTELFGEGAFLIKLWFFIFLGFSLQFESLRAYIIGAWIVAGIYFARFVIARLLLPRTTPIYDASMVSLMVPKGLVSAVLASAYAVAVPDATFIRDIAFAVVVISIALTSVLIPAHSMPLVRGAYRFGLGSGFPDSAPTPASDPVLPPAPPAETPAPSPPPNT